ncbi:MAG: cytochrome c biogenesis protein CcsA [Bacteroidota bacterium]
MTGGFAGEMFVALAFAAALVAMVSFVFAEKETGTEAKKWERLGLGAFGAHIFSILGVIVTLFLLIYHHRYEYHYVWSHSSNELPVYYMISCFWEGQEGSFLLWCFWHCVLGGILMWRLDTEWRNLVMATIASVELILSSMILGVYAGQGWVYGIYILLAALPLAYAGYQLWKQTSSPQGTSPLNGAFHLGTVMMGLIVLAMIVRGQMGFYFDWSITSSFDSFSHAIFTLLLIGTAGYASLFGVSLRQSGEQAPQPADIFAGLSMLAIALGAAMFPADLWKVGSTPFVMLRDALPDAEAFQQNPDFIPSNGTGLNPLLQNYWMVIHPPTLFLGFASTTVPFAFVVAGLVKRKYKEWIRPATPWTIFSVMILGVGIIMGGYWAYETLNFGGYWNWDPVENGSLVPWLVGVASLHIMVIYQKARTHLRLSMILVILTFLLVLYATFLTRSGILGDTSVHTFTDLGLSGQLLVLCLVYAIGIVVLMALRWKEIPAKVDEAKVWSAEFFLFLGVLVFLFSSAVVLLSTSLPVFNKIFGSNVAPPPELQYFYYKWNVWFAVGFGVLSGMAQFLWWKKGRDKSVVDALFRPFVVAMVAGSAVLVALFYYEMEFAYHSKAQTLLEQAGEAGFAQALFKYIEFAFVVLADELLLFSAIFSFVANLDVLISMVATKKVKLMMMGGSLAHIGFALMLLGMLFSSGYDEVISKNLTPDQLNGFPEQEKADNVLLVKDKPRYIKGYEVTYLGRKEAQKPVKDIQVIEENASAFKVSFRDSTGDVFAMVLPRDVFLKKEEGESVIHPTSDRSGSMSPDLDGEIDMEYTEWFLNTNLKYLRPKHINNRVLYGLQFRALTDSSHKFVLYPEAEDNETMGSIIAHPSRKVYLDRDIYVHVSWTPNDEEMEPKYRYHDLNLKVGDTAHIGQNTLILGTVYDLSQREEMKKFEIAAAARMFATAGSDTFYADPIYLVSKEGKPGMIEANIEPLHMSMAFVGINPKDGSMQFQIQELLNPDQDMVVFKAISKPWINVLWLGTFILTFGFLLAIYRRVKG